MSTPEETAPPPSGQPVIASQARQSPPFYKRPWVIAVSIIAAVVIIGGLASGGSTESDTPVEEAPIVLMPDFAGERLDVAISDLTALGVNEDDIEIVGGGTFGILDESNWYVCEQTPTSSIELTSPYRFIVDRTCATSAANATPTQEESAAPSETESTPEIAEPDSPIIFSASTQGNIDDIRKDIGDLEVAIKDDSVFRILSNVAEINFNIGQLGSANPPLTIAEAWNEALSELDSEVSALTDLVSEDGTTKQVQGQIKNVKSALNQLQTVIEQL